MHIKKILLISLALLLLASPCLAFEWNNFESPRALGYSISGGDEFLVVDYDSATAKYSIYELYPDGSSSQLKIYNMPAVDDVAYDSSGDIYFILRTGGVIYKKTGSGTVDYENQDEGALTLLGSTGESAASGIMHQMVIDANDIVFVTNAGSTDNVFAFAPPYYMKATYYSQGTSPALGNALGIALHPDGIITSDEIDEDLHIIYGSENASVLSANAASTQVNAMQSFACTDNGNIYVVHQDFGLYCFNYTTSTWTSQIDSGNYNDIVILDDGVLYVSDSSSGIVKNIATIDSNIGYSYTPTPTGGDVDVSVASVSWENVYVLDDVGSYTWNVDSENWNDDSYIYKCIVSRVSDNGQYDLEVHDTGELTSQTGSQDIIFDTATAYKVELKKYSKADLYIGIIFEPDVLAMDTITITAGGQSQINAPASAQKGQVFDISYNYGYTPTDPEIRIKKLEGIQYNVISTIATTASPAAGTTYTTTGTIYETGYYVVELYDKDKGSQATDSIQIIYTYTPPENPINDNFIEATKSSYALGEYCRGSYAIDDTNFTAYDVRLEVYNADKSLIAFSVPAVQQLNTFDIGLFDYHFYDDGDQLHPVNPNFMAGAHDIRLTGYYSNGTQALILNSDSFTITDVTTEGYGLILSKGEVDQEEQFTISAVSPTAANVKMLDSMDRPVKTWAINGSMDIPFKLSVPGNYQIQLLTTEGELKANQLLTVRDNGIVIDPNGGSGTEEDIYNNFLAFFLKPMFWGLLMFIGIVGGMAQSKHINGQSLGVIAFLMVQLFAIVGLWAPYTMYIVVSSWIIAGMFFSVGRNMAKGDV